MVEPCGAFVVELGQRAIFEDGGGLVVNGENAVGIAGHDFGHAFDEVRRVQPVFAQFVQPSGGLGNGNGARIGGVLRGLEYWG